MKVLTACLFASIALIANVTGQQPVDPSLIIPPPMVSEPTPIPLPPTIPGATPAFVSPDQPAVSNGLMMPSPKSEMLGLIPTFLVKNMSRALEFYREKLGFAIALQSESNYTAISRDLIQIGLALDKTLPKGRFSSCYVKMTRIDVYYAEVKSRGVKPTAELKTHPSKMREFSVTDPDGNILIFGEYVGQPAAIVP